MPHIDDKIVAFIVKDSITNCTVEQAGVQVRDEPNVGLTAMAFPLCGRGAGKIMVQPYNFYDGDDCIFIQELNMVLPGNPPSYIPNAFHWEEEGELMQVSQSGPISMGYDEAGNFLGYRYIGNMVERWLQVEFKRATEGIRFTCPASVRCLMKNAAKDEWFIDCYGSTEFFMPLRASTYEERQLFGKMGSVAVVGVQLAIGDGYSMTPVPPATSTARVFISTIGRY